MTVLYIALLTTALFLLCVTSSQAAPKEAGPNKVDPEYVPTGHVDGIDRIGVRSMAACDTFPCVNGGTCYDTGANTYQCKCTPYYIGPNCMTESLTNLALGECGTTCNISSTQLGPEYPCELVIDGYSESPPDHWQTFDEREGAWYRVNFDNYYRIHSLVLYDKCNLANAGQALRLDTSDYKFTNVDLLCPAVDTCADKFWQVFELVPTITNFLHIEYTLVCDPAAAIGVTVGFQGIMVYGNNVPLNNAAALSAGATCTASSAYNEEDFGCQNAIDGVDTPGIGNEWASNGEGAGAWIQIDFGKTITVMGVGFLQRCSQLTQNSFLMLEFSDGSSQEIQLECFSGADPLDCDGQYWQQFDINPPVYTTYVTVRITAVCSADNNGFREIRIFDINGEPAL